MSLGATLTWVQLHPCFVSWGSLASHAQWGVLALSVATRRMQMWRVEHRATGFHCHGLPQRTPWASTPVTSALSSRWLLWDPLCMTLLHSWDALSLEGSERKSQRVGKRNGKRQQEEICRRLSTGPLWAAAALKPSLALC